MGMLDRYKRAGGIKELVALLESSPDAKKERLLELIRKEDSAFAWQVEARLLSWDIIRQINPDVLAEIVANAPPQILARAMFGESEEFTKLVEKCIKNFNEYKEAKEAIKDSPPTKDQVAAAHRKIFDEARKVEAANNIQLISDDMIKSFIASKTGEGGGGSSTSLDKLSSGQNADPSGGATIEGGAPAIETFKLEEPPPGLSGERLEQFFKNNLKT